MKLFRASQRSVVHIEAVLTSNQSPVWPAKIFQTFINTVVCKRCLSQSFGHQSTSCAKKSYKSSSLLEYFDWFQSNHTVECCTINVSGLSQMRRKKNFCFASNVSIFLLYFFCATAVVSLQRLANYSPCTPLIFCSSPTRYAHRLLKNDFFRMFMGNFWERNREREIFRLKTFQDKEAKSYFLHCSAL